MSYRARRSTSITTRARGHLAAAITLAAIVISLLVAGVRYVGLIVALSAAGASCYAIWGVSCLMRRRDELPPDGLDPETIAAVYRIQQRLTQRTSWRDVG